MFKWFLRSIVVDLVMNLIIFVLIVAAGYYFFHGKVEQVKDYLAGNGQTAAPWPKPLQQAQPKAAGDPVNELLKGISKTVDQIAVTGIVKQQPAQQRAIDDGRYSEDQKPEDYYSDVKPGRQDTEGGQQ